MAEANSARQQITEKVKDASNILVTVGKDPSVDELSAALGLTLMLNKLNKHATAVVSGTLPPAIEFLEPGKTFEHTVDSLRDFIIALDKEKADHLRYKVDGDVVKIFITPYKTKINEDDLDFSQGDYNVELVLALGVRDEDHLDAALSAHGKILHDATVATIDTSGGKSEIGSITWEDGAASSICEMLVGLSEAIKGDKTLLDEQSSTALLTGIVAATDRFSNELTSSKSMTMAAQLMAAGANQQLIATKLEEAHEITDANNEQDTPADDTARNDEESESPESEEKSEDDDGTGALAINHELEGDVDAVARQVREENSSQAEQAANDALAQSNSENDDNADAAEAKLSEQLGIADSPVGGALPSLDDLHKDIAAASSDVDDAADSNDDTDAPSMGGTLNATSAQAAKDAAEAAKNDINHTILSHDDQGHAFVQPPSNPVANTAVMNASVMDANDEPSVLDPTAAGPGPVDAESNDMSLPPLSYETTGTPAGSPTLDQLDKEHRNGVAPADAVATEQSAQNMPIVPPQGMPPMPDFSTLPPPPPPPPFGMPPANVADVTMDAPSVDQPPAGAVPADQLNQMFAQQPPAEQSPLPSDPNDPNQFKLPGQS